MANLDDVPSYEPPAYNDVVSSPDSVSHQPSAPPISDIQVTDDRPPAVNPSFPPTAATSGGGGGGAARHRGSGVDETDYGTKKKPNVFQSYVVYSIALNLRKYMNPDDSHEDPELDVEAQFARHVVRRAQTAIKKKRRLQCISGWLWCFGAIQTLFYVVLPVAMFVTGIFVIHRDKCPFRSNTIGIYLVLGGSVLTLLILTRIIASVITCGQNRSKHGAIYRDCLTTCIATFEVIFYIILVINMIVLCLGTYWIFETRPPECPASDSEATVGPTESDDCCATGIYIASASYNVFQYVLYGLTFIYVFLTVCCIRSMDSDNITK